VLLAGAWAGVGAHGGADAALELTGWTALTGWTFEWLPALAVAVTALGYLAGVRRLRRRGDRWPVGRTVSFVGLGLGGTVLATQSFLATYDTTLFWVHMAQHMLLAMLVPIFLALGAPITLALRTLPARPRRLLLAVLHSRVAAVLTFPLVTGLIFVLNPFVLYFTGLYQATLENPLLHDWNHVHFVVVGALWYWPLLGIDPMPRRLPYGLRLLAAFAVLPFHAWLGVTVMASSTLIAGEFYADLGRSWGPSLAQDQQLAGGLLWSSGELVGLVVFAVLLVQWMRHSEREAVREDRRLDRLEAQAAARTRPLDG